MRRPKKKVEDLKEGVQNWTDLFFEDTYIHPQNKQEYRQIIMNRDGFTLLAMGFTGKKALQFKLKYIDAFNQMETHIKLQAKPQLSLDELTIKRMNAEARLKNADARQAKLLAELAMNSASDVNKAILQNKATEVLTGEKLLEMPKISQRYVDSVQIAKQLGVLSKSGKPHGTAISQLIKYHIDLEEGESEIFPEYKDGWSGDVVKYADSVIKKIEKWLENKVYPSTIVGGAKKYYVNYKFCSKERRGGK